MKILAIGDLVGENGTQKLIENLKNIQEAEKIDITIVNAENAAGGSGLSTALYTKLARQNIDVLTMGNHTWGKKDIFSIMNDSEILIRPANYSREVPGVGYRVFEKNGKKILVVNLIGRVGMAEQSNSPFECIDDILKTVEHDVVIIDFHAEATAEKRAMAYYVDGRVNVLFGTHTHVQTADEEIFENGLGFITDLGMTGPKNSVIGMNVEASLKRFTTSIPERYKLAEGECKLNSVVFELDDKTLKCKKIYRVNL